jgi:hypothetical protein
MNFKGIKWAQIQTLIAAIASTLESTFAKKSDLNAFADPHFDGDTLVFPSRNAANSNGAE